MAKEVKTIGGITAVILAGGLGTRLREQLPEGVPKSMALVAGEPFLEHLLRYLEDAGVQSIVLSLGYGAEHILRFLESRGQRVANIRWRIEPHPLGTGGGVRWVLPLTGSDPVLVLNGDSFVLGNLAAFLDFYCEHDARILLMLARVANASRFGSVSLQPDGAITSFQEKNPDMCMNGLINAGIYLLQRELIADFSEGVPFSLERELFPRYCGNGLYGLLADSPFIDIGTPESLATGDNFFTFISQSR